MFSSTPTATRTAGVPAPRRPAATDSRPVVDPYLPGPPGDTERDLYFGSQSRWINPVSLASYVLIVISVALFIVRNPATIPLALPLAVSAVGTTISVLTASRGRRWTLRQHRDRVADWQPDYLPSVDVFLPTAGEPLEVLANTYFYVSLLEWPGELDVLVLDDAARPEVRDLAERHGFRYLSRPDRGHVKKAGNLRYGFDHSHGDHILVLDADFVPRRDLFYELVPYLDDPRVGIVQSPQFFDLDRRMNWLQRAAGATQVLFYRWVQPARDSSDAAICVGTSALYRREALAASGGFALIGHSEDVFTGIEQFKHGYVLRYVPTVVTKGLCPDRLDQFLSQQYRWCLGSMSLMMSKDFHQMRMSLMQRLCYWSGFLYYVTTAINVFVMAIPPLVLAYFDAAQVEPANYAFVALAMVGRQAIVPAITLGRESMLGLARIQTTYSFCHATALFDALRGRVDGWAPTGARTSNPTAVRVRRLIRVWCVGVQAALWVAILWRTPQYGLGNFWCLILVTVLNLWMVLPLVLGREKSLLPAGLRAWRHGGSAR